MQQPEIYERKRKIIEDIKSNYQQVERSIVEQLYMKQRIHGGTVGSEREDIWKQLFEMVLPKKFVMEQSVFIIDSYNGISNEVDLAIIDETYTPYIFRFGKLKFIPIEAVAAVVECKSQNLNANKVKAWSQSIQKLKTSSRAIVRMASEIAIDSAPIQKSTRPIRILCEMKILKRKNNRIPKIADHFDFMLEAIKLENDINSDSNGYIKIISNSTKHSLLEWYKTLNLYEIEDSEVDQIMKLAIKRDKNHLLENSNLDDYQVRLHNNDKVKNNTTNLISLLTFNFQLNQLLMLINNPMLFPHRAYVDMFNGITTEEKGEL